MRDFYDYLTIRPPLLVLVEPDVRWAQTVIQLAVAALGTDAGPVLEWTITRGFQGNTEFLRKAGLPQNAGGKAAGVEPVAHLMQFASWLGSQIAGDSVKSTGTAPTDKKPFTDGVLTAYDMDTVLATPVAARLLAEIVEQLGERGATIVLPLPHALPDGHPLASLAVQVGAPAAPEVRYGALAGGFVLQLQQLAPAAAPRLAEVRAALPPLLAGLSQTAAQVVLQLALVDLVHAEGGATGTPPADPAAVLAIVRRAREEFVASLPPGAPRPAAGPVAGPAEA